MAEPETKWLYAGSKIRWIERDGERILQQQMVLANTEKLEIIERKWVDVEVEPEEP
jgi:hypothetical protein